MSDVKKILIIETAFIGDAVLSLALAEEIKRLRPPIEIEYLAAPASAPLLSYAPSLSQVHVFDKRKTDAGTAGLERMAARINAVAPDAVIALHESRRSAALISRLRARYKIGSSSAKHLQPYLTHSYILPLTGRRTEKIIELARFFSDDILHSTLPSLDFSHYELPDHIRKLSDTIVIAPGSAWNTKKWLGESFIEVGRELVRQGKTIVIIGSSDDMSIGDYIAGAIGTGAINVAGRMDIVAAGAIISRSKLVIGNDSAPIHIATACGVRSVEIMGPTVPDFGFIAPAELGSIVEQEGLWCRPCNSHGAGQCPIYTHECMTSLTSDMVLRAAMSTLENAIP